MFKPIHDTRRRLGWWRQERRDLRAVHDSIGHLRGPTGVELRPDQCVLLCVLRNAEYHLPCFVDHHRALGVTHMVFLDNGSDDGTVDYLRGLHGVTVLRSTLPFADYKARFKQYLVRRYGRRGWSLTLDSDELWQYPGDAAVPFRDLLRYLNGHRYTGVMAHLLDHFSPGPLMRKTPFGRGLRDRYPLFDLDGLIARDYDEADNHVALDTPLHYWGGVSNTRFGIPEIYLTKIPLLRWHRRVRAYETSHVSRGLRLADLTTVIRHFRFTDRFADKLRRVVAEGQYYRRSEYYRRYQAALEQQPALRLDGPTAQRFRDADDLVRRRFLQVGPRYRDFAGVAA